jgi:D-serine deaminase-like pyridoxal phosphate-dependent protein
LAYNLREAIWLVENDVTDDVLMGYPSVDRIALARLLSSARLSEAITLMVDSPAHLDLVSSVLPTGGSVRIALDIDAGLKVGPTRIGVKRSPLFSTESVVSMARDVLGRSGFELVGVMTYEGQVAGLADNVPDARVRSLAVRRVKSASVRQLGERRAAIAAALAQIVPLRLWNAGGSGSVETSAADPVVTEVAAGSGLLVPTLFDHYRSFHPRPAAFFGVPVVRRPSDTTATVAGGGLIASGATGTDRSPLPWAPPGLSLTKLEGAGEVQTPLDGPGATHLSIGDLVWFRHAKSGELMEHVTKAHLVSGASLVDVVATYRGTGNAW